MWSDQKFSHHQISYKLKKQFNGRCKIGTGSEGSLMCIRMHKIFFSHTNINDINKAISNKNLW